MALAQRVHSTFAFPPETSKSNILKYRYPRKSLPTSMGGLFVLFDSIFPRLTVKLSN
jgi:hypothetical protein